MECNHQIQLKSGIIVPCGKCPACLANLRQEWIFRLKQEYKSSVFSIFVTLTYSDDFLPADHSVNKKDVQDFHKRLRKHFPPGDLRYYVVSEYGDHTFRPHYHGLYFFQSLYDINYAYDIFLKSWGKGFIKFGEVEEGSIVYCTKYVLKISPQPKNLAKPFRLMSKMSGGVGIHYLDSMSDYHVNISNFQFVADNGKKCRMPRYYRDRLHNTRGSSKYNPLHFRLLEDQDNSRRENLRQRFLRFIQLRSLPNDQNSLRSFFEVEKKQRENRDQLLIKHVKKQKM